MIMDHNKSLFIKALDRCEDRRDGGYKLTWRCSLSDDSEDDSRNDAALVTMEPAGGQQDLSPEGMKSPSVKGFSPNQSMMTHERHPNHLRPLNRTGKLSEAAHSFLIMSPAPSQGVVVQGRIFQHAQISPPVRKLEQRNHDLKERSDMIQELDSIVLTCPDTSDSGDNTLKRRVQQKRRLLIDSPVPAVKPVDPPLRPDEYVSVCGECGQGSEDHVKCDHCGYRLPAEDPPVPDGTSTPAPRPPIRSQSLSAPHSLLISKNFYGSASGGRSQGLNIVVNPTVRITHGNLLVSYNERPVPGSGSLASNGHNQVGVKKKQVTKPCELNDPIVLSSDEEEESDNASSTGTVNRLDSVSPRPADSAHSSPAPSGGRVEAAIKGASDQEDSIGDFFTEKNHRTLLPRRNRMRDPHGLVCEEPSPLKKRKVGQQQQKLDSIILECRSVRIGTLRRMVTKPVVFSVDYIEFETEGREVDVMESVRLRSSELISCEWCNVKKLPVLFLQTTDEESRRLRDQLEMCQDREGEWYDCGGDSDEKYIVLIFENGPQLQEQIILEDILGEIGQRNKLEDFPLKINFDKANNRLVEYNKASKEKEKAKEDNVKPVESARSSSLTLPASASLSLVTVTVATTTAPVPSAAASVRTRLSARLQAFCEDDDDDDMSEIHPTFTGPVVKLMVYPPPPAKGGISVTNEDLHCLNDGEFLNDVIIDFYLKYVFLEMLKKEDAARSHVFSSFFYKRLNQRERRNAPDTSNLPIQKRKHNRVKTWTRHVDLFQKDFIFVPINESAHWYLAVICFPGLDGVHSEPNLLYKPPTAAQSLAVSSVLSTEEEEPEISHHAAAVTGQSDACDEAGQKYTEDTCRFSDDQSSCPDDCSEDGTFLDDCGNSDRLEWTSKPTICRQPCILIMDSLRGPTRSTVVKTLREYLEVEWEVRKGSQRSFGKDVMKGSSPRVPQQDNFSDCGVYVLQYVESFFENPIPSFHLPMNLMDWFPQQRMKTKREEIKDVILNIQKQQQVNAESAEPTDGCQSPSEDNLESPDLIPSVSS
ncbi:Sentrin-specific protease 6 [Triplophysa tibetana]|uniref:Sentrin-specific protease 6 n=1 Tax=Triplophysa tibetana TaxID=1572043 RepID=A0A5A9NIS3_9TELE|nr:Sentrin-specific protease 6 [Triplophysa tibetana]